MGKSTARKNFTTPRKTPPKHVDVRRQTTRVNNQKQTGVESAFDLKDRLSQNEPGPAIIPSEPLDEFGNPLTPNNDAFFDGGAEAQ
jgi:hypothetical protein